MADSDLLFDTIVEMTFDIKTSEGSKTEASTNAEYVDANKKHFNSQVEVFEKPFLLDLAHRVAVGYRKWYTFDKEKSVVLDFACGTGLISRELVGDVKSIIGVDIAEATVDKYNEIATQRGFAPEKMRAVAVELKGEEGELDGLKFDAVVCSNSYHHFPDVDAITKLLAFFLKPGGALLVVDHLRTEDTPKTDMEYGNFNEIIAHKHGFTEAEMRKIFEGAGLSDVGLIKLTNASVNGHVGTFFVSRALKPL